MRNIIRWRARSQLATEQRIYRSAGLIDLNNLPVPIAILAKDVEEWVDEDVILGAEYQYLISSYTDGVEKFSDPINIDTGLPSFGPGPQTLVAHNETEGYFGEVSSDELITGDALASLAGVSGGGSQNSTTNWLKFFIDDKIVFVSKKTIRHSISWDMLNEANVVDGSRNIVIGNRVYKIGLLKGLGPDTSGYERNSYDNPATYGSEWNRLMYPVASDVGISEDRQKHSQTIDNWANFPQDDSADGLNISAGSGRYSWCQEVDPLTPANRVYRGNGSVTRLLDSTSSSATSFYGWRVRLELVTS